jgi:hypothetical protein
MGWGCSLRDIRGWWQTLWACQFEISREEVDNFLPSWSGERCWTPSLKYVCTPGPEASELREVLRFRKEMQVIDQTRRRSTGTRLCWRVCSEAEGWKLRRWWSSARQDQITCSAVWSVLYAQLTRRKRKWSLEVVGTVLDIDCCCEETRFAFVARQLQPEWGTSTRVGFWAVNHQNVRTWKQINNK